MLHSPTVSRLREWGANRLLRRMHRLTHRIPTHLRPVERARVMVVAPHMDDEVLGPGGTLALHRERGSDVRVAFCADGSPPETDPVRRREAHGVSKLMRFAETRWLGFPDGRLCLHEEDMALALAAVMERWQPTQVFCPHPTDHHRDHSATALAVGHALRHVRFDGEVWSYEMWSPLWPNTAVDITPVMPVKREAIARYRSQVTDLHYIDGVVGLNRYRALRVYVPYAEAFYVTGSAAYQDLCQQMNVL